LPENYKGSLPSIKEITKLIESRNQLAKQACGQYAALVNSIIASQTKDVNHISLTLDYMWIIRRCRASTYSVETPTDNDHSFKGTGRRSASSDLSFYENNVKILNMSSLRKVYFCHKVTKALSYTKIIILNNNTL
jgi:hypothetical protein